MSMRVLLEVWLSLMMPTNTNLVSNQLKTYKNPSTTTLILSGASSFAIGLIAQIAASQVCPSSKLAPYAGWGIGILLDNYAIQRNLTTYATAECQANTIQLIDTTKNQFTSANYEQNYYDVDIPNAKQTYASPLQATISRSCFALGTLLGLYLKDKIEEQKEK